MLKMFERLNICTEVKIPRAHPVYPAGEVASVASDTIPSDYPSETPSEAEAAHTNQAFMMDESYHSEGIDALSFSFSLTITVLKCKSYVAEAFTNTLTDTK